MINDPNLPTASKTHFSHSPENGPRHTLWLWVIGVVVIALIIGTAGVFVFAHQGTSSSSHTGAQAIATATNTPAITPTMTASSTGNSTGSSPGGAASSSGGDGITVSQAKTTVVFYYRDINSKNYQGAYSRWGKSYHNMTPYQTFAQGFSATQRDGLQLGAVVPLADNTIKVQVTVTAIVSSFNSPTVNTYQGYYVVGLEIGQPRLLSANLQFTNSNKDSVKRAVSLIEQYYDDINMQDYSDAYAIWWSAYHKNTSSYQFAKGFDTTRSVSIAINTEGATILDDGTVRIPLAITSVNTSGSGTTVHNYQGYYIVGMENEVWHLVSATIH